MEGVHHMCVKVREEEKEGEGGREGRLLLLLLPEPLFKG